MKKILCLLVLFCSLSAFATDYSGRLDVTVGSKTSTTEDQQAKADVSGTTVTFTIYDFWYGWIPCGDVKVTATCVNGVVSGPVTISIIGIPISSAQISGTVNNLNCNINLSITSGSDNILIDYSGAKIN